MTDSPAPTTGDRIGTGRTADVVAFDRTRVVKWFHESVSEASIRRETTNADVAAGLGIPTPAVCGQIDRDDRRGIVFERVAGSTLAADILARPWRVVTVARRFADLHHRVHATALGDDDTDVPPLKPRLRERIDSVDVPDSTRQRALDVLDTLPDGDALCHGDYHPENVLVGDDGLRVIDWLDATVGHPAADVARTSLVLRLARPPDESSVVGATAFRFVVDCFRRCYLRRYLSRVAFERRLIETWELPVAVARMDEAVSDERSTLEERIETLVETVQNGGTDDRRA